MKKIVLSCLLLAGCATDGTSVSGGKAETERLLDETRRAYIICNLENSRRVAGQFGDPLSLAIASEAMCSREKRAYQTALTQDMGPRLADRVLSANTEDQIRANASVIVANRQ